MSHTMNIETEITDAKALESACERLKYKFCSEIREHSLYASQETGMRIDIPGWQHPVVVKEGGQLAYDHYEGRWGNPDDIPKLKANYGIEKAKIESRKKGYLTYETIDEQTGNLELTIKMGE